MGGEGRAPLEAAERRAQELGRMLKEGMPEGWGFVLVLASFGEAGYSTYVSNLDRGGAASLMRELAGKIEADRRGR